MNKSFKVLSLAIALSTGCEGADESDAQPGSQADRLTAACTRLCQTNEDFCKEPGTTKASGRSCLDHCKASYEEDAPKADATGQNGAKNQVTEACSDAYLALFECVSHLSCEQIHEENADGDSQHCQREAEIAFDACMPGSLSIN